MHTKTCSTSLVEVIKHNFIVNLSNIFQDKPLGNPTLLQTGSAIPDTKVPLWPSGEHTRLEIQRIWVQSQEKADT